MGKLAGMTWISWRSIYEFKKNMWAIPSNLSNWSTGSFGNDDGSESNNDWSTPSYIWHKVAPLGEALLWTDNTFICHHTSVLAQPLPYGSEMHLWSCFVFQSKEFPPLISNFIMNALIQNNWTEAEAFFGWYGSDLHPPQDPIILFS